ncbi:MerR family transcriptional regulator [Streptomyces otsuchiensis]|uniref:MerR family transcriptional regulator n=1 Tax=Streptomyces otsuchiensis TaxID=2681388 RepID=UPI0010305921|nr:MerR family transcriptional regulator [Streptomyces otsuchiensis]
MRLSELSERGGVATATIKYYLREGLLPAGRRVSATQAEYGEEHLRRLRLIRALTQVGRVPVATARDVLAAIDDESDQFERLGAAVYALPHGPDPDEADPLTERASRCVEELVAELGWHDECASPPHRMLVSSVAALMRLGYPCGPRELLPYGRAAAVLAETDVALVAESFEPGMTRIEAAVALTVLYEPVLLSLRRLAHTEVSRRRFASEGPPSTGSGAVPAEGAGRGGG